MKSFKQIFLSLGVMLTVGALTGSYFFWQDQDATGHYTPRETSEKVSGYGGAEEYYNALRANVNTGKVEPEDLIKGRQGARAFARTSSQRAGGLGLEWTEMGPDNVGGRTRAILFDQEDNSIMFAGGVSGGLWKSKDAGNSWSQVEGFDDNLIVSSLAQLGNGNIYVGTGSSHDGPSGTGGSGFVGDGLFVSTDGGETFQHAKDENGNNIQPAPWDRFDDWVVFDELAADPNNDDELWVANGGGLYKYDESSQSLTLANGFPTSNCDHVVVSEDGDVVVASTGGGDVYLSTDGGDNFNKETSGIDQAGMINNNGVGRAELAISPDDPNYIYVSMAATNSSMFGVFMTDDMGETWHQIGPKGSGGWNPFNNGLSNQGLYDNAITVVPGKPTTILLGGITLWRWKNNPTPFNEYAGQWEQLATNVGYPSTVPLYVHSDIHEFNWTKDGTLFIGSDGGISRSEDLQQFIPANRGYNIVQYYSVAHSPHNEVLGGTQDNGTQYIDHTGNTWMEAQQVNGGDGFDCDISQMDPEVMFSTIYNGAIERSVDGGGSFSALLSSVDQRDDFYTNLRLFEDPNDTDSEDSLWYKNTTGNTLYMGDSIYLTSRTVKKEFGLELQQDSLVNGDSIRVQDRVQSLLAIPADMSDGYGVYVTRQAMRLSVDIPFIRWWQVLDLSGGKTVNCLEFSADGDHLFIGLRDGDVYRVSGLDEAYKNDNSLTTQRVYNGNTIITGIACDPNDPDHVLITRGGYGTSQKVLEATNATNTSGGVNFTNIWTNDPDIRNMPVYDAIIHREDPSYIIVGTEHGVYSTTDGGTNWNVENDGLGIVPVFAVRQQAWGWNKGVTNPGVIYLGTHGRGIFKSETLLSTKPVEDKKKEEELFSDLSVYPNPMQTSGTIAFDVHDQTEATIRIYGMDGRVMKDLSRRKLDRGHREIRFDAGDLGEGTYLVGDQRKVAKFMVVK